MFGVAQHASGSYRAPPREDPPRSRGGAVAAELVAGDQSTPADICNPLETALEIDAGQVVWRCRFYCRRAILRSVFARVTTLSTE